jgi:kynureninase
MQALIERGVIGDFRAPDRLRFGFTPLYLGAEDVLRGVTIIEQVIASRCWDAPKYRQKALVT